MTILKVLAWLSLAIVALILAFNIWGYLTLGTISPAEDSYRDPQANRVVMVFGATGSVGDGLLKSALEDPLVEHVYVVSRRSSTRIDAAVASGTAQLILLEDFTDYSSIASLLPQVNTVMWGLGTSSMQVDDVTYSKIHVDFPVAFLHAWLSARKEGPMAFHFVTGMGTDPEGSAHWAREKGKTEREMAALGEGTGLRSFSYRSAYVRPAAEQANIFHYIGEALLMPGYLVISATELGQAMLEISTRTAELPNGTLIDNADSIAFARLYRGSLTK